MKRSYRVEPVPSMLELKITTLPSGLGSPNGMAQY